MKFYFRTRIELRVYFRRYFTKMFRLNNGSLNRIRYLNICRFESTEKNKLVQESNKSVQEESSQKNDFNYGMNDRS